MKIEADPDGFLVGSTVPTNVPVEALSLAKANLAWHSLVHLLLPVPKQQQQIA